MIPLVVEMKCFVRNEEDLDVMMIMCVRDECLGDESVGKGRCVVVGFVDGVESGMIRYWEWDLDR